MAAFVPLMLLVLLLSPAYSLSSDYNLEFVSTVFRHGDRSPVTVFPNSEYQESFWPQGLGQLSTIGMAEEFHLGEIYNDLYIKTGFLCSNYTRVEVQLRSTDYDRTLMSGESMLAGLYPPEADQQFEPGLVWQPIPVHTVPQEIDQLLRSWVIECPEFNRLLELDKTTEEYQKREGDNQDLFEMLSRVAGTTYDLSNLWSIGDELFCENAHNLKMPSWYSDDLLYNKIKPLKDYQFGLFFDSKTKRKITGGIWANEVITNMQKKAARSDDMKDLKMVFYSSHDTTVAAMLSVFDMYNDLQPSYSSSFNVELYSKDNEYFVKFRYRNDTFTDEVLDLKQPQCSEDPCPLQELANIMSDFMITEDEKESLCHPDSNSSSMNPLTIALLVTACVCGFLLAVTLLIMVIVLITSFRQRRKMQQYKQLTTTEDI